MASVPRGKPHIQVAGASEQGRRANNQDVFHADAAAGLFLIADGVGASQHGDVAARLAVDAIIAAVDAGPAGRAASDLLRDAVQAADRAIREHKEAERIEKMSCALVVALLREQTLTVANAGDARAYLRSAGELRLLTFDHTVANMMLSRGYITADQYTKHHLRHTLTTSVGGSQKLEIAVAESAVAAGDRILLCSDGVSDVLSNEAMAELLGHDAPAQALAERLVEQAVETSGKDNATAIVICPAW